jgi:hypothetical protein
MPKRWLRASVGRPSGSVAGVRSMRSLPALGPRIAERTHCRGGAERPRRCQRARNQTKVISSGQGEVAVSFHLAGLPIRCRPPSHGRVALQTCSDRRVRIAAEQTVRLGAQELRPAGAEAPRRRPQARPAQHGRDRRCGDADPELQQLTLDTDVAPPRVWGAKTRCAPEKSLICRQDANFGTPQAQNHDLKLPLTPTASKQTNETAEEPVQQTGQQDAQSEPLPAMIVGQRRATSRWCQRSSVRGLTRRPSTHVGGENDSARLTRADPLAAAAAAASAGARSTVRAATPGSPTPSTSVTDQGAPPARTDAEQPSRQATRANATSTGRESPTLPGRKPNTS